MRVAIGRVVISTIHSSLQPLTYDAVLLGEFAPALLDALILAC